MKRSYLFICLMLGFCLATVTLSAQWEIIISSIPSQTPESDQIFIAGNFNNWNPGHNSYKLTKNQDGFWTISLQVSPGNYQFKFTRGSWATVEGTEDGKVISNRNYQYTGGKQTLTLQIKGWEDQSGPVSTASPQVSLLSEAFFMPQLKKSRKIWLYLPKDYTTSEKRYPVIYMHDGQNLFDRSTSFLDEWKVDESLDSLYDKGDYGCIIIGIENGGQSRINEYTPWPHPNHGGGDGEKYVRFIAETLKPYIDENYRTLPDVKYTAIAGSSLGGLISHFAGVRFQNTFGRIGSLSPSLWFTSDIYSIVSETGIGNKVRFYMSTGTDESATQVNDVNRMADSLSKYGLKEQDLKVNIVPGGKHNEWLWQKEFPLMYQWFWANEDFSSSVYDSPDNYDFKIYRSADTLVCQGENMAAYTYSISNISGQNIQSGIAAAYIPVESSATISPVVVSFWLDGKFAFSRLLP